MAKQKKTKVKEQCPVLKDCVIGINDSHLQKLFACHKCMQDIKKGERFVLVGTYVLNHTFESRSKKKLTTCANVGLVEEKAFHIQCWRELLEQMVEVRFKNAQKQAVDMLNSNPFFQQIKQMLPKTIPVVD